MHNEKEIRWLYQQLPIWEEQGILTQEATAKLKQFYGNSATKPAYHWGGIVASILGALLIGAGIISIFAYNWENLSHSWRTFLSFLPLFSAQLIYGYTYFQKYTSTAWREASSAFLMLMLGSSIALISQTYNLGGTLSEFLFSWMVLSLPLVYLMNSSLVAIFYMIGITNWAIGAPTNERIYYYLLLLGILPHLYRNINPKNITYSSVLLAWVWVICFFIGYLNTMNWSLVNYFWLGLAIWASFYYFLGQYLFHRSSNPLRNPFQAVGLIIIVILGFIFSFDWGIHTTSLPKIDFFSESNFWILLVGIAAYVGIQWLNNKERLGSPLLIALFPVLVLIGIWLTLNHYESIAIFLANLYLIGLGLYFLQQGVRYRNMSQVNLGFLIIAGLVLIRFFNADLDFVTKGIIFIVVGLLFLGANIYISRQLKQLPEKN